MVPQSFCDNEWQHFPFLVIYVTIIFYVTITTNKRKIKDIKISKKSIIIIVYKRGVYISQMVLLIMNTILKGIVMLLLYYKRFIVLSGPELAIIFMISTYHQLL